MEIRNNTIEHLKVGTARLEIHVDREAVGKAAANGLVQAFQEFDKSGNVRSDSFAADASRAATLAPLTSTPKSTLA